LKSGLQFSELREVNGMQKSTRVEAPDPYDYGYGLRVMKESKVCKHCGNTEAAEKYTCTKCGKRLPLQTVFQIYQTKHKICELCDTILAPYMHYCPHCGTHIKQT